MAHVKPATLAIRVEYGGTPTPAALAQLDAALAERPDAVDLRFARACLLEELGRLGLARGAYRGVLARDATNFGALLNLGTMHAHSGERAMARVLYTKATQHHPSEPAGFIDLGNVLAEDGEFAAAEAAYARALALDPPNASAHFALAQLLASQGREADAAPHRAAAFATPIVRVAPYRGAGTPRRVLELVSAHGGNIVTSLFFDDRETERTTLVAETYRPGMALPEHEVIFNAIADADRAGEALAAAEAIVAAAGTPVINRPERVAATQRSSTAEQLAGLAGVVAPRSVRLGRAGLNAAHLAALGFSFPLLVRAAGHHMGEHFERVDTAADLDDVVARLPGDEFYAIAFVDGRNEIDGKYRKFRALFIDGTVYPLHLAIARAWKVHYFSAEMRESAPHRAEEGSFLEDMAGHLGPGPMRALGEIAATLGLDYAGIDFGLDPQRNVLVYEANAAMAFYLPDDDPRFAYRSPAVDRVLRAVRALVDRKLDRV